MSFKVGDRLKDEFFGEGKVVETNDKDILVQFKKANSFLHNGSMGRNGPYEDNACYWYSKDTTKLKKIKDYTYKDLKKSPLGTKLTFENGKVLIKTEENRFENGVSVTETRLINNHFEDKFCGKITKIEEPEYTTVYEHKTEILDEAEKRYLRGVVRPFKDKIKTIEKNKMDDTEYIFIKFENWLDNFALPNFKEKTMYKNMETNKSYTLEELGL